MPLSISRLQKKKDIDAVFRKGVKFKEGFLVLRAVKSGNEDSRLGFVISKKVSKKASLRNRLRRRMREIAKKIIDLQGIDILLIATPGLETKNFCELEDILKKLFKRAGLAKEKL